MWYLWKHSPLWSGTKENLQMYRVFTVLKTQICVTRPQCLNKGFIHPLRYFHLFHKGRQLLVFCRIEPLYSWFQTFAVFWMLYAFFWVISRRLNFICRRFGTLCLFHLHRRLWKWNRVFRNVGIWNSDAGELSRRKHTTGPLHYLEAGTTSFVWEEGIRGEYLGLSMTR